MEKPRVHVGHVQGHAPEIVSDPPSEHKGLVEVNEVGITAKAWGKRLVSKMAVTSSKETNFLLPRIRNSRR